MGDRAMKANIGILVNVQGVTITDEAQAVTTRGLADMIRTGAKFTKRYISVECDETNGVITINEARKP
jgi:hypothetical protein